MLHREKLLSKNPSPEAAPLATEKYPREQATLQSFTFKRVCSRLEERNSSTRLPREGSALFDGRRKESRLRTFEIQVLPGVRPDRARRVLGGMRVRWSRPMLT